MKRLVTGSASAHGFVRADLLVVLILVPLVLMGVLGLLSSTCRSSETANRVKCASNLRQIGQAIMLYATDNGGAYPQARFMSGERVTPTWGTGPATTQPFADNGPGPNDVSAALFLLLRTQEITGEVFTCPSSSAERWEFGGGSNTALNWSNWSGVDGVRRHLSYSYQNPYPDDAAVKRGFKLDKNISAEFAVAGDINPGTSRGANVPSIPMTASSRDMRQANSRNHDGDGQNVLYGDGHVEFQSNRFCGVKRDNIYARRAGSDSMASSDVRNSPYDANDSVLLPTDE